MVVFSRISCGSLYNLSVNLAQDNVLRLFEEQIFEVLVSVLIFSSGISIVLKIFYPPLLSSYFLLYHLASLFISGKALNFILHLADSL